jgi:hypothetical protein
MRVWNGTAWQAVASLPDLVVESSFTATAGQTSAAFGLGGYRIGYLYVYVNGVLLAAADITATDGSNVTFASALAAGDEVRMLTFKAVGSVTTADIGALNAANPSYTGTLTGGTGVINIGSGQLYKDASGNLGLGVTPSAFEVFTALQVKNAAVLGLNAGQSHFTHNSYFQEPGGVATWKYIGSGNALRYSMISGQHTWSIAPSGTAGNAISFSEAMRIDSSGNLLVGTTSARDAGGTRSIAINSGALAASLDLTCTSGRSYAIFTSASATGLQFYDLTANTERARIDSSGNLRVGATGVVYNAGERLSIRTPDGGAGRTGVGITGAEGELVGMWNRTVGSSTLIAFATGTGGTGVGSITTNGTSAAYNTSSDYRLKHDIQPMQNALATVAQLKPVTYKWNADDSQSQGFIAHELQEVVPECVTGEKDAVDAEGKPVYQGIDTSFLVATLTAAIKEQQAIIEQLKARLDAANL